MTKFDKAKEEYMSIKSPDGLVKTLESTIKNTKIKHYLPLKIASAAACVAVVGVVAVNALPSLAYAMGDIPILGSIVRVVTFGRYEHTENGYEANIVTPQIEGLLDKELENKLNTEFKENANFIIAAYERDVKELKEEFGDETVHMSITSDYEIKTDNEEILAVDVYIYTAAGSSSTKHSFYNINKKTGELLTLEGMFKKDADYVGSISEYIKNEMKRKNSEEDLNFWIDGEENSFDGFDKIKENQNFYINNNGNIVIVFDKYEVAPGYMGSPEFEIPNELINIL